jgi:antitoxin component HigA of HigAB toxin-antitoxin module
MTTPLDSYMTRKNIKDGDFAPLIGRSRTLVSKIRRGVRRPTLDIAAAIENETKGEVPMVSWVNGGTTMRKRQRSAAK